MADIRLQSALGHVDRMSARVAYKVDRTSRAGPHLLAGRGQREILRSHFFRWVILILDRRIQTNLQAVDQAVNLPKGDDDARCTLVELDRPLPIVIDVKTGYALYGIAPLYQLLRQRAAHPGRRRALETIALDLFIRQSPYRAQMLPVGAV